MNLDILIKLIKLANHNNADGEANAAARKVCQMIEDDKFQCLNGKERIVEKIVYKDKEPVQYQPPKSPIRPPSSGYRRGPVNTWDAAEEESDYWEKVEDYIRSGGKSEDPFRAKPDPPFNPFENPNQTWGNPFNRGEYEPHIGFEYGPNRKKHREGDTRKLQCKTCKQWINTKFVGVAVMFECTNCQWKE
jgi:hypothetical protein